jgi:glycerophosphoryl diester phosphodiesterase
MKIIYHTADVTKDAENLNTILNSNVETVEIDFVFTEDGVPIWTHEMFPTIISHSTDASKKGQLTLYDVLDINNHRCKFMLDLKFIPRHILYSSKFYELIEKLNAYDEFQIQSLDLTFLTRLKEAHFSNIEVGLIINVLTKWYITTLKKLPNLDFESISSELWERDNGSFIEKCNAIDPNAKKYAWTWASRVEDEYKIDTFINKGADGIITGTPDYVKKLASRNIYQRNISFN